MDTAEKRFVWLLNQRNYKFVSEIDLQEFLDIPVQIKKRPDFYFSTKYGNVLAEIESFEEKSDLDKLEKGCTSFNGDKIFNRIRNSVHCGAKQLKPFKYLDVPMIVVLDNWRQVGIPTDINALIYLFGNIFVGVKMSFLQNGKTLGKEYYYFHKGEKRLSEDRHTYVSAVVVNISSERYLDDDMTLERKMKVRVLHNPFAIRKLDFQIFNENGDEQFYLKDGKWVKYEI